MPIDWFTVVAQAINFLILVWLLKRFLYKPILQAIDEREKGIAAQLADAEAKKAEAQKERDELHRKSEAIDQERAALLKKATDDAQAERQRLLALARKDADAFRAKRQDALRLDQRSLSQEINRWTQKEVFAIARKALADLATVNLEERVNDEFVRRLRALAGPGKDQLVAALNESAAPACVRSAYDLSQVQRSSIEAAVKDTGALKTEVKFETLPALIGGIELSAGGQKVAWSIADYLATLEMSAGEMFRKEADLERNGDVKHGCEPVASAPKADH